MLISDWRTWPEHSQPSHPASVLGRALASVGEVVSPAKDPPVTSQTGLNAIRNLDYTILLCRDIEVMSRFYATVLGFSLRSEIPGKWAEFQVGASLLALRGRTRPYDGHAPKVGAASVQLAFRVPPGDVDLAANQLAEHGIDLLEPVADLEPFGHRALFFADPEHNVIEIYGEL